MPTDKTPAQRLAEKKLRERLRMGKNPITGKKDNPSSGDKTKQAGSLAERLKQLMNAPKKLLEKAGG